MFKLRDYQQAASTILRSKIFSEEIDMIGKHMLELYMELLVGAVADNFDERIEQKIFHCEIVVDNERVAAETKAYRKIPVITNFVDENGVDRMKEMIKENYDLIKVEAKQIVADELERIKIDPNLQNLLKSE